MPHLHNARVVEDIHPPRPPQPGVAPVDVALEVGDGGGVGAQGVRRGGCVAIVIFIINIFRMIIFFDNNDIILTF